MINPQLQLSDFDYHLPHELIAQQPAKERHQSRLLRIDNQNIVHDHVFTDLLQFLKPHDLLVFNNTKVMKARLYGTKISGGKIEGLVERIITPHKALMHLKASKSPKAGTSLIFADQINATVEGRHEDLFEVTFEQEVLTVLDQFGSLPLPPYIEHSADNEDDKRYQTVYADPIGAVAAPTAGLHFDQTMLDKLPTLGIQTAFVTLHVGAGTFQPVRVEKISDHIMHAEWYEVSPHTVEAIKQCRANDGRVFAVGTTSVRALESAAAQAGLMDNQRIPLPHQGDTRLFITPGYTPKVVDGLLTNFHLPQSTLLMLVSAFIGIDTMQKAYAHAIKERYRFFSYGDAMLIEPRA
ncbi:tRNA preQ1(34) S-adenosylmethionine ribosyltransferase-isomerase QueA [Pelistega sp. NLN82]|uniref:S-adenosylmethionine:tRNA ribosyltransferase-isomerase n=1 Tax=Pelistega ratti TaxID=2652177 RepID=A0A6L9Y332_9BURK|nr:tRNA preQ1(34) S-adenosylmethionine ribosyltransferase-isomerase QueA [Pelistega ratti]NEN74761.1 tRNA preQ1(34) S-adenosylmethionine ribosyltransferase-isomerase QueA [Pelistega ratti]